MHVLYGYLLYVEQMVIQKVKKRCPYLSRLNKAKNVRQIGHPAFYDKCECTHFTKQPQGIVCGPTAYVCLKVCVKWKTQRK